ncbi:glycosyltransferase [Paucihalobacter ruber]|uniref:Glycosyltransferase n=1 Tax=Paucihalobacter ruber TaxID=2567861 RepID=A0A506PPR5_9FLAO|nr:glycosyltransferase [Paucihalobacter ruber]TPV35569.1 glycosyltransferase [Paucihalobacter ruber]
MNDIAGIVKPTKIELIIIRFMILIGCFSIINFLYWFLLPEFQLHPLLYGLLCFTIFYGILRVLYIWYCYWNISIPKPPTSKETFTVDILTTFFPGEPYEMIVETLKAIQNISYPHRTYLCDEANDAYLKQVCKDLGVTHVTRDNRIDAKAGNINNALKIATGDICVVFDPDHVPNSDFLDPIIPFFNDPKIGFVQIVQSYYNTDDTLVARGAAEQTYQFYGPMMMTMNSYGTVNAIGANCTFRRAALDSIGGHAPGLTEDMHTAMLLHSKGWTSVYVPKVLARGLVPNSLTSYFKQQLKWARGSFDLLFFVYPKLFTKFTMRQKLHYGLLPLHYLAGVLYLINFLIPILSLVFFKMPWSGNVLYFGIIVLPLLMSIFFLRIYIQKWLIEKRERGFHFVGGLLQITSWWYYFLGFVYTIFRKNVPYIPTPKGSEENSNYKIILPNLIVAGLSISAVVYGLNKDLTPFSIIMAGFALLNAGFMIFSLYLTNQVTNKNTILRKRFHKKALEFSINVKGYYRQFSNYLFRNIRPIALPLLIGVLCFSVFAQIQYGKSQWEAVDGTENLTVSRRYLGIFNPLEDNGLSDYKQISDLEKKQNVKFDIISFYVAWGDRDSINSNTKIISEIYKMNALPMISWEPWASDFARSDSLPELKNEKNILKYIKNGHFDDYVLKFANYLKSFNKPVFLRFGHEFDNPFYPWSTTGGNSPEDFIEAWTHIYKLFEDCGSDNAVWVWNPWKSEGMQNYFPGDDYVDWIGITGLNYGIYNEDQHWYSFQELYHPFHNEIKKFTEKPVMIAEFGSLKEGGNQAVWLEEGLKSIDEKFTEIKAIVLFNSNVDNNVPNNLNVKTEKLDWTLNSFAPFQFNYAHDLPSYLFNDSIRINKLKTKETVQQLPKKVFTGVAYKKGQNWKANNYVPSRDVLVTDFELMKKVGLHTIRYEGLTIYDHNVINISREMGMSLIFSFWLPSDLDFAADHEAKRQLRINILNKVKKLKGEKHILSWNLGNDNRSKLIKTYNEPILSYQTKAYLEWLRELILDIKKIDSSRPVIMDIELDNKTLDRIDYMQDIGIATDIYGFLINDINVLNEFKSDPRSNKISYQISDIDNESFFKFKSELKNTGVVLRNWQDQWENNKVSFDGLLDFKGRKKTIYSKLITRDTDNSLIKDSEVIRILVPSILLFPNNSVIYHAVMQQDNNWVYPDAIKYNDAFEWVLVKKDLYGNKLALKELGKGVSKAITIPEDYNYYELMLIYIEDSTVKSVRTQLNTKINMTPSNDFDENGLEE